MALTDLNEIRTKFRRLTRTPSTAQITDAQIDQYVNTFLLYDLPEHLRTFSLRTTFRWFTTPNVDTYPVSTDPNNPLFDFVNIYTNFYPPVYVAGYEVQYTQSRDEFYGYYPFTNTIQTIGTGDGVTTVFTGTLQRNVLRNNVAFTTVFVDGTDGRVVDNGSGSFTGNVGIGPNAIDYTTGQYSFTYDQAPASDSPVYVMYYPYVADRPRMILYYNDTFVLRPVPDKQYPVIIEADTLPTELLLNGQSPTIKQWWQYIAYGAAKKRFEDQMDMDSVQNIMPEFKTQERLVERRTLVQLSNERTATIYTQQVGPTGAYGWYGYRGF